MEGIDLRQTKESEKVIMPTQKSTTSDKVINVAAGIGALWLLIFVLGPIALVFMFVGVSCGAAISGS